MYSFYIDDMLMPIVPEALTTKITNKNKIYDTIDGTGYNQPNPPGLTDWEVTVQIPTKPYPFAKYENGYLEPIVFLNKFESLKVGMKVFHMLMIRPEEWDNDVTCTLEDYNVSETAKTAGMLEIKLKIKQYVDKRTKNYKITTNEDVIEEGNLNPDPPANNGTDFEKSGYIIQVGDTALNIILKVFSAYTGDKTVSQYVYRKNANTKKIDYVEGGNLGIKIRYYYVEGLMQLNSLSYYLYPAVGKNTNEWKKFDSMGVKPLIIGDKLKIDYNYIIDYADRKQKEGSFTTGGTGNIRLGS